MRIGGSVLLATDKRFTGQRQEAAGSDALGLYDYGARFYSTAVGRFLGVDPIAAGGPQGLNAYSYVQNNPMRYTDPSGMCIPDISCPGGNKSGSKPKPTARSVL